MQKYYVLIKKLPEINLWKLLIEDIEYLYTYIKTKSIFIRFNSWSGKYTVFNNYATMADMHEINKDEMSILLVWEIVIRAPPASGRACKQSPAAEHASDRQRWNMQAIANGRKYKWSLVVEHASDHQLQPCDLSKVGSMQSRSWSMPTAAYPYSCPACWQWNMQVLASGGTFKNLPAVVMQFF